MRLEILLLLAGACFCTADVDFDVDIKEQLQHFEFHRYPNDLYEKNLNASRSYIKGVLKDIGFTVETHEFNTSINANILDIDREDKEVIGQNIIGILHAKSDKPEAVIVVGADYDTNGVDNPLYNNGAGISVLLETARLFSYNVRWSGEFQLNFTTIFVAFDANTREHQTSGGKPGGYYFVRNWLWKFLNESDANFGGAYILDSVMNVNLEMKSQTIGEDFKATFPDAFERIKTNEEKGDFLSMVTFDNEKSLKLREQFSASYNKDKRKRQYHLEDLTMPKNVPLNKLITSLTRQETFHFWSFQDKEVSKPLPALLLTDTESLRKVPVTEGCLNDMCSLDKTLTPLRESFLETTTQALVRTLLKRQASVLKSAGNLASTVPSLIVSMVTMLMVYNH